MSNLFRLSWRDVGKGLIVAITTAIILFLYDLATKAGLHYDLALLRQLGDVSVLAGLAYLVKNFLSNNEGKFLGHL